MIAKRISEAQGLLKEKGITACIIPSSDPHQSEYVAKRFESRVWLSGFTGSAGTLVIMQDRALLWTDSRYFIQAESQLKGSGIELMKQGTKGVLSLVDFLKQELNGGDVVSLNGELFTENQITKYKDALLELNVNFNTSFDLILNVWLMRPELPRKDVYIHELQYSCDPAVSKIESIRKRVKAAGAQVHLDSSLDGIAWTLNLRGEDVECNPVFYAHLLIRENSCVLFIDQSQISNRVDKHLNELSVIVKPYESFLDSLSEIEHKILLDPDMISQAVFDKINSSLIVRAASPSRWLKAVKNRKQIDHTHNAMAKDGRALLRSFLWLEGQLDNKQTVGEYDFGLKLNEFRKKEALFVGDSFNPIVGYKGNGAIVHYRAEEESCAQIESNGCLLVDSGGQYLDGTTDITRTVWLGGAIPDDLKLAYTCVLKGMIALSRMVYPKGTTGVQMDTLARQFLWANGMNFGHGTGHGVGYFMNVHEPPQGIVNYPNIERGSTAHEPGMISSNEPGFYKIGEFGIRIENLLVTVNHSQHQSFLCFENLTVFPIDLSMVDWSMMSPKEKSWINDYHQTVYTSISALGLDPNEEAWLKKKCQEV